MIANKAGTTCHQDPSARQQLACSSIKLAYDAYCLAQSLGLRLAPATAGAL